MRKSKLVTFVLGFVLGGIVVGGIGVWIYVSYLSDALGMLKYLNEDEIQELIDQGKLFDEEEFVADISQRAEKRAREDAIKNYLAMADPEDKISIQRLSRYFNAQALRKQFYIFAGKRFVLCDLDTYMTDSDNLILLTLVNQEQVLLSPKILKPITYEKIEAVLRESHEQYGTSTQKHFFADDNGDFFLSSLDGDQQHPGCCLSSIVSAGGEYFLLRILAYMENKGRAEKQLKIIYDNRRITN